MNAIWRDPPAETCDYPGLWVADDRVTGSITDGQSRLPLWCYITLVAEQGFNDRVTESWPPHEMTAAHLGDFLYHLLNLRGEFGRLVCVLADIERRPERGGWAWWEHKTHRQRVIKQLQRCLDVLKGMERL